MCAATHAGDQPPTHSCPLPPPPAPRPPAPKLTTHNPPLSQSQHVCVQYVGSYPLTTTTTTTPPKPLLPKSTHLQSQSPAGVSRVGLKLCPVSHRLPHHTHPTHKPLPPQPTTHLQSQSPVGVCPVCQRRAHAALLHPSSWAAHHHAAPPWQPAVTRFDACMRVWGGDHFVSNGMCTEL
jgi:hypothetical protein